MDTMYVYLDHEINGIPAGVYPVISTNETYERQPTSAKINVDGTEMTVSVSKYSWGHFEGAGQFVYGTELPQHLKEVDEMTTEEVRNNLDGLHHSEYTVDEFIEEFGGGDEKEALKLAIRNDHDAMPMTKKRSDDIFISVMKKHGRY